jgi:hypothetical protein
MRCVAGVGHLFKVQWWYRRRTGAAGVPAALMQLEVWNELGHSTADDLHLTGRQDISR